MNPKNFKDLMGKKFTRLIVVGRAPSDSCGNAYWFVKCDCGSNRTQRVKGYALREGLVKSCKCLHHEEMSKRLSLAPGECAFNECFRNYFCMARKRNLLFELTKEQFRELTQGPCYYCGIEPAQEFKVPSNNGSYIYNGIDRLNSNLGYAIENCVPACGLHNLMKLDMTVEQFLQACQAVIDHQSKRLGESAAH